MSHGQAEVSVVCVATQVRDHPEGKTIAFSCCLLPSGVGMLPAMVDGGMVRIALRAASLKIEDAVVLFLTE